MNHLILPILSFALAQSAPSKDAKVLHMLPWSSDVVCAVAFLSNDKVAVGNQRGVILVWDLATKSDRTAEPVRRLVGHTARINRLQLSPDGKTLVSASSDRTVKYWDALKSDGVPGTIVLNDGYSFVGVTEKVDKLPNLPPPITAKIVEQKPIRECTGHKEWIWGLGITADGKALATGDDAKQVILSDAQTGAELRRWQVNQWIRSLDISPDGKLVVTAEHFPHTNNNFVEAGLRGWDTQTGKLKFDASKLLKSGVNAVRFSPDGKHLAFAVGHIDRDGDNGKLFLLNPTTGDKVRELTPPHLRGATDLAFHPDGKHLVTCGRDRAVKIWQLSDGGLVREINVPLQDQKKKGPFTPTLHALSVCPDGKLAAVADAEGAVQILALAGK